MRRVFHKLQKRRFQIACRREERCLVDCTLSGPDGGPVFTIRHVESVPSLLPAMPDDPFILTSDPGLFPDPLLPGFRVMDALSSPEYCRPGGGNFSPVPCISVVEKFWDLELPERWVYYCGNYQDGLSNRQFGMPSARFRVFSVLLYLEKIGRPAVEALIHEGLDRPLTFHRYPRSAQWLLELRERVNRAFCC